MGRNDTSQVMEKAGMQQRGQIRRLAHARMVTVAMSGILGVVGGCASLSKNDKVNYETVACDDIANFEEARKLNAKGLLAFEKQNLEGAEKHFREALVQNTNYGPAHNNLGQVLLARHELYTAAWEFELAANLMPDRVEPIINQGLVYELAGRHERAEQFYRMAYEMDPRNGEAIGCLARVLIKQEAQPMEIHHLLKELILHESRPEWVYWAEELVATRYRDDGVEVAAMFGEVPESASDTYPLRSTTPQRPPRSTSPAMPETLPLPKGVPMIEALPMDVVPHPEKSTRLENRFTMPAERPVHISEIIRVERTP